MFLSFLRATTKRAKNNNQKHLNVHPLLFSGIFNSLFLFIRLECYRLTPLFSIESTTFKKDEIPKLKLNQIP